MLEEDAHSPNRNVNGMLSLFPEAEIIAPETNGPITAEVLPIFTTVSMRCEQGLEYYHRKQRKEEEPAQRIAIKDFPLSAEKDRNTGHLG